MFEKNLQRLEKGQEKSYSIHIPPIAQLVEQIPLKDKVLGSIPSGRIGNNWNWYL